MGLEGVGQAVEQGVPLARVVGLVLLQGRQLEPLAQLVQPAPTPGAVFEDSVQIGARHHTPLGSRGCPPAQLVVIGQGGAVALIRLLAEALVELEPLH